MSDVWLVAGALLAEALGIGDRAEGGADADCGPGGVGDVLRLLIDSGGVVAILGVLPVGGGCGDRVQFGWMAGSIFWRLGIHGSLGSVGNA